MLAGRELALYHDPQRAAIIGARSLSTGLSTGPTQRMMREIVREQFLLLTAYRAMGHKAVPLMVVFAGLLTFTLPTVAAESGSRLRIPMPDGSKYLGDDRYQSPRDLPTTIKIVERGLARRGLKTRFRTVIDLPEVVAAHAESPSSKTAWSGINVSRYGGQTWIFVIRRDRTP